MRGQSREEEQSAEGSRRDQSTEQVSQEMRVGHRGDQSTEVRTYRYRVDQCEEMSQHSKGLCGSFMQIHAHNSLQMHGEMHKSVTDFPLLHLELTQA